MPPTTRATSQKAPDPPGPATAKKSVARNSRSRKKAKRAKKAVEATQSPVESVAPRCMMLELPPEVRNRVYDFCEEETFVYHYALDSDLPCALRKTKHRETLQGKSARTFFSLTQICKQIRQEYRPLWLRQSSVLVDFEDFEDFITTFYCIPGSPQTWHHDAPQNLFVAWDHDTSEYAEDNTLLHIKPLLELRATTPSSKIQFVPCVVTDHDVVSAECPMCGSRLRERLNHQSNEDQDSDYECDSECDYELRYGSHMDLYGGDLPQIYEEYFYLEFLNQFLGHSKPVWLESVRKFSGSMKVDCTMSADCEEVAIYIRFDGIYTPEMLCRKNLYGSAVAYLTEMGFLDLDLRHGLDFVVGVSTGKWLQPCMHTYDPQPVYEQTVICGSTYEPPTAEPSTTTTNPTPAV